MNKNLIYLSVVILIVVLTGIFFNNHVSYKKIITESEIPQSVLEKLNETDLERGVYVFTGNFVDGYAYLAFCGGEDYPNNYDVTIKKLSKKTDLRTHYNVSIEESSEPKVDYSSDFKYPIVIYRVKSYSRMSEKSLMFEVSEISNDGNKVPVINWWGNNVRESSKKQFSYQLITERNDIPKVILDKLDYYKFEDTPATYIFTPSYTAFTSFDDIDDLYLVISPGKKNVDKYNVVIENIYSPRRSNDSHSLIFYVSLREQYHTNYGHFTNFQGYPFEVLKISSPLIKNRFRSAYGRTYATNIVVGSVYSIKNNTSYYTLPYIYMNTTKEWLK